jgi:hypothetical protein
VAGWAFLLWQVAGMLFYGSVVVVILAQLSKRYGWPQWRDRVLLDVCMVPFYIGAAAAAFILIDPIDIAVFMFLANLVAAGLMVWYARRGLPSHRTGETNG